MENCNKIEIFSILDDHAKHDDLSTGINVIKVWYMLSDAEFLPIYNEWLAKN